MSRTVIAAQEPDGSYPALPLAGGAADLTLTAADVGNSNYAALVDGKTLILATNTDSGNHHVTFTSVVDSLNRTGDITSYVIAAGAISIFGPFDSIGWAHTGQQLFFSADDATVKFAVITLP